MNTRPQTQAELNHLAAMLPEWIAHLRDPAEFWPQFDALARELLQRADPADAAYARAALARMRANAPVSPR
ncbi:hypothetical protein [Xanthomonas sp.]|uniref:hypothetical protein n=1 Tax=Xanthomonas sp. TaxID=29446 RepID=UPI001F133171|nr:hypothetical protein [Xanthomonas sp.]